MSNHFTLDNGILGTGTTCGEGVQPGRCSTAQQGGPGRHHATAESSGSVVGAREGRGVKSKKSRKEGRRGRFKEKWTDEERRVLWECFVRSGGKKSGGYIKKLKDMWDGKDLSVRGVPSLLSQLKQIEINNLLTVMVREEIERKVRGEVDVGDRDGENKSDGSSGEEDSDGDEAVDFRVEPDDGVVYLTEVEWEKLFGGSDDETFDGFLEETGVTQLYDWRGLMSGRVEMM